ncbi:MAG: insulinase family protein [Planctomycetia bacterium]|nr:insulinase family protein [Planctomycetia bacterium]
MIRAAAILALTAAVALAEDAPLPTDPAVVSGQLDNGLRYLVRKHAVPPGRATVWLHIHSGSLNETDPQRGIAHYLEHMAFNGSENFKPGSLIPFFESLGMQFGRDQNAFTNMEQTTYQLSLPKTDAETLGKGFLYFADVLFRLSLTPEEIESERQIILEERRRGLSARQRTGDYVMERIAPGSLFGQRDTIGTEETVKTVKRPDFLDYYGTWYTASNATLMVVADAEPAEVVKAIRERFGAAPKKDRPAGRSPGVKATEKSFGIVATDAELTADQVQIVRLEPARPPTLTEGQLRDDLVLRLGVSALNRRLERKVEAGGTSYQSGRVSAGNEGSLLYSAELTGRAVAGKWKAALAELALELQRARAFGFTDRELEAVRAQILSGAERAVETEATQPAGTLVRAMNSAVSAGEPVVSAAQALELLRKLLPSIRGEEVTKRFAREFDFQAAAFVAVLPAGAGVPTEAQLVEAGTAALAVKPEKEAETAGATELMKEVPKAGEVKEVEDHAASKVVSAWLSNGVRLRYRFMDERKNDATVTITLPGGELLESAETRGLTQAAMVAWSHPATKGLTSAEIRDLMTGKKVNVNSGAGGGGRGGRGGRGAGAGSAPGTISLTVSGSPDDLETGLQLAHLLLTQPRVEAAGFEQFRETMRQIFAETEKSPTQLGARLAGALPFPEDEPRTRPLAAADLDRITLAAAQAWLERLVKESPVEVSIVGDVPKDRALELAARYLGSIPSRERIAPTSLASVRTIKRPAGPRRIDREIDTPTPQAFVFSGFYGANQADAADARCLSLASRILSTRLMAQVREKEQLVYSIGASSRAAFVYPGFGVFSASAPTEPAKAARLVESLAAVYAEFAKSGPTAEEMETALKQVATAYAEQVKDPSYWTARLQALTWQGLSLDDVVNEPAAVAALTAKQVQEAFAKYGDPKNAIVVVVKPTAGK